MENRLLQFKKTDERLAKLNSYSKRINSIGTNNKSNYSNPSYYTRSEPIAKVNQGHYVPIGNK